MERDLNELMHNAQAAFDQGDYPAALELFKAMEASGVATAELWYNTGLTYARLEQWGWARLYTERALLLSPGNEDATHNLAYITSAMTDTVVPPIATLGQEVSELLRTVLQPESWGLLALFVALVTAGILAAIKLRKLRWSPRWGIAGTILALTLTLAAWTARPASNLAVVVELSSYGYSAPNAQGKQLFMLSEGQAGKVTSSRDEWVEVEMGDGRKAWFSRAEWAMVQ